VLIIPDAVRLQNVEQLRNFDFETLHGTNSIRIAAFQVANQYQCTQLKVDLR
jgi:hypothetical protein